MSLQDSSSSVTERNLSWNKLQQQSSLEDPELLRYCDNVNELNDFQSRPHEFKLRSESRPVLYISNLSIKSKLLRELVRQACR